MSPLLLGLILGCHPPVDVNNAPTVLIESPTPGSVHNEGSTVRVEVQVYDRDQDLLTVELASSIDGVVDSTDVPAGETVVLVASSLQAGNHTLTVTVSDGVSSSEQQIAITINGAPSEAVIEFDPASPTALDELRAVVTAAPVDPEGGQLSYRWYWEDDSDGVYTDGATNFDQPHVLSEPHARDEVWTFVLEATEADNGGYPMPDGITTTTRESVIVANAAPGLATLAVEPTSPHPAATLHCVVTSPAVDPDGDTVTYTTSWDRDGTDAGISETSVLAHYTHTGEVWTCQVTASDGAAEGPVATASTTIGGRDVPVTTLDARVTGNASGLEVGRHVAGLPVVDSDEHADLVVGVPLYNSTDTGLVAVYATGLTGATDLSARSHSLAGSSYWELGGPLASVPDVDGDGWDDLLVGARGAPRVVLFPGHTVSSPMPVDLTDSFGGVTLLHATGLAGFGAAVAGGDLDGDGRGDVLVTTDVPGGLSTVSLWSGASLIGDTYTTSDAIVTLTSTTADDGFGLALATGDVNGDGVDDLLASAPQRPSGAFAWLFTDVDASASLGDAEVVLTHSDAAALPGTALTVVPDLTGDGYDDMLVSAPYEVQTDAVGMVGLVSGGVSLQPSQSFDAATLMLRLYGDTDGAGFGTDVVVVGDTTGDGEPEIAISAPYADSGSVYLFSAADLAPLVALGAEDDVGAAMVVFRGQAVGDELGVPGPVGDLDRDGWPDLVLGAPLASSSPHTSSGAIYVMLTGE